MAKPALPPRLVRAVDGDTDERAWCLKALCTYFHSSVGEGPRYTGACFDRLGGGGDAPEVANTITAADLLAVGLLDVPVPGDAVLRFLGPDAEKITGLLAKVEVSIDLHAGSADVGPRSEAADLWDLLRAWRQPDVPGAGVTTTSKLLARKRPRLLPIYDRVVADQLGLRDQRDYWREIQDLLRQDGVVPFLSDLVREESLDDVSVLRAFDVLLWMNDPRRRDTVGHHDHALALGWRQR
jgi:hypothetical protein